MPGIMSRLGREVLVCDGAMGTMLQRLGTPPGVCPEQLNVLEPETVAEVHRLYTLAGAQCASTNTFGATRAKLAEWGLEDQVESLNRAAVRIARDSGALHILADVGPSGLVMEPIGRATLRGGLRTLRRAGPGAGGRVTRRHPLGDVHRHRRGALRSAGREVGDRPARVRKRHVRYAGPHGPLGHGPRDRCDHPRGAGRGRGGHELRARAGADAAVGGADGRCDLASHHRAAERRHAAARRRSHRLSGHA